MMWIVCEDEVVQVEMLCHGAVISIVKILDKPGKTRHRRNAQIFDTEFDATMFLLQNLQKRRLISVNELKRIDASIEVVASRCAELL